MNLIERVTLSEKQQEERDEFLFQHHAEHSKMKGDWHFRQAAQISGDADYIPGVDDGEPPTDYSRLEK